MNTKTEATPLEIKGHFIVRNKTAVVNIFEGQEQEAELIVKAVNAHDAHVAFINRVVEVHAMANDEKQFAQLIDEIIHEGRRLVGNAKAEGK